MCCVREDITQLIFAGKCKPLWNKTLQERIHTGRGKLF